MKIITRDERLREKSGVKMLMVGPPKIGKTALLYTLDPERTLFIDFEAGDLAVKDWPGDTLRPRTWSECRDLACFLAGANPALPPTACYSQAHLDAIRSSFDGLWLDKYDTFFVDSVTAVGRLCYGHAQEQPEAFSERSGKRDTRAAYGVHARELIAWLLQLQHARGKNVIFVAILEWAADEFRRGEWSIQLEGQKTARELPGIVDQIVTMNFVDFGDKQPPVRCFVCQPNVWRFPAGDRSGKLNLLEKPHLGELLAKLVAPAERKPFTYQTPTTPQLQET
jgi:hypothetical protein